MAPETDWNCGGVGDIGGGSRSHWWWALGGAAQIGWGISSFLRGCAGDSRLMPFKAFSVASLFVGGAASASFAALQASGIRKVEDLMEVGANIRRSLGVRPRARANGYAFIPCSSSNWMGKHRRTMMHLRSICDAPQVQIKFAVDESRDASAVNGFLSCHASHGFCTKHQFDYLIWTILNWSHGTV
ncbi:hypothetical protein SAY87_011158 [Trapa incisa]|uniref:Uncharacterized protein n=1 Tax=Trapa incisa TaxID=236973 RepID=A0AAN7JBA8_9MYRT|nr:hypothetical protein SAY87_011158 [Trapa incisa]